ncbi:hypothetical protein MASSI9I_60392 [Massilia sp. 9I]|nr:hypothetical protein MASSI9I_60392 [Massilia sp. 9I]
MQDGGGGLGGGAVCVQLRGREEVGSAASTTDRQYITYGASLQKGPGLAGAPNVAKLLYCIF